MRSYHKGMKLTKARGLKEPEKASLKALGAVED